MNHLVRDKPRGSFVNCCDLNVKMLLKCSITETSYSIFGRTISKMLEDDLKVRPGALSSLRQASLAPSSVMTPAHAGSGSHLAAPGSDLSNQMELAKHHTPASALSGSGGAGERERGRARRRSGWEEVCRWLITAHICSPHFLLYVLSLKCAADCLNFNSLPVLGYRLLFDFDSKGKCFDGAPLAEGGP